MSLTVCLVNYQALAAVSLSWESLLAHHPRPRLYAWDNGSTDGAAEYLQGEADRFWSGDNSREHGWCLDQLIREVETEYTLVLDNDVVFYGSLLPDMQAQAAFCVAPAPRWDPGHFTCRGLPVTGQPRIDPCCALFQTRPLQALLQQVSFGTYLGVGTHEFFDTGAMVYRAAQCAGLRVEQPLWIWDRLVHWGAVSGMWQDPDSPYALSRHERYAMIQALLAQQRRGEALR
jgi:hypothetical protein